MRLLVSALEYSANLHLASLLQYTQDITLKGIFSKELGSPIIDMQDKAIMGFSDAIKNLPFFYKLANKMVKEAANVDKVLLIDSSGFNLPLAKKLKKHYPNLELIYYILPQAWAWKRKRIYTLTNTIDKLLSILPFEKEIYPKEANIEYVGHPLLDKITFSKEIPKTTEHILFMPGSRVSEITKLMPIFQKIAKELKNKELFLAVPPFLKNKLQIYGDISYFNIVFDSYKALQKADFAFICSGTATLEAALMNTPFVLVYKAKPIDFFIGKHLVKLNYIGLANIFFEKMGKDPMHLEFLQDEVTPKNLLQAFYSFDFSKFDKNNKILRNYLKHGSAKKVATILQQ